MPVSNATNSPSTQPMGPTDYTTNAELDAIRAQYTTQNPDGTTSVDYDAIADAIQSWDPANHQYDIEDLITAYFLGRNELPPALATAGSLSDPEAHAHLWSHEVRSSLRQLGDLVTDQSDEISAFLALDPRDAVSRGEDLLNRILESTDGEDDESDSFNLFEPEDLQEVMSLFIGFGNPGMALLLYTAYGLSPAMRELQEAALEVVEDSGMQVEDLLSELESISPDDEDAQAQSQRIQQQMSVVNSVISTMNQFIRDAQNIVDQELQLASNLSEQTHRTQEAIIRNMA